MGLNPGGVLAALALRGDEAVAGVAPGPLTWWQRLLLRRRKARPNLGASGRGKKAAPPALPSLPRSDQEGGDLAVFSCCEARRLPD